MTGRQIFIATVCLLGALVEKRPAYAAPANDAFASRIALSGTTNFVISSNVGATLEPGEYFFGADGGSSVWWSWLAPTSGTFSVSTDGSSFDTLVAVYRGSQLSNLVALAVDDDSGSNGASRAIFRAIAGESYPIAVDGFQGASGQITLSLGPSGYTAPEWTLPTPNGVGTLSLIQFRGKVVLLDFFETICGACTDEMPDLRRLRNELAARGFEVVGIALDPNQANVKENMAFLGITFPVALYTREVEAAYANNGSGVVPMPTKFLIDREGKIQMRIEGGYDFYFYYPLAVPLLTGTTTLGLKGRTQAGAMVLSWPANEFGWVVDAATNGLRLPWTQITGPTGPTNDEDSVTWPASVVVTNDENTVSLPLSGNGSFYRLRKSQP